MDNQTKKRTGRPVHINTRAHKSLRLLPKVVTTQRKALCAAIKVSTGADLTSECIKYFSWFDRQVQGRGIRGALAKAKAVHHLAVSYMLKQPVRPKYWIALDKQGFPKCVKSLKKYTRSNNGIQAVNSLLAYYRQIVLPALPDFGPITEEGTAVSNVLLDELMSNVPDDWKFNPESLDAPKIIFRSRRGPNGHATFTCAEDLQALQDDPELYQALETYLLASNGDDILDIMESLEEDLVQASDKKVHSRLAVKREGGGKSRIFAIADYWTQVALKPLHDKVFKILRDLPYDCTFNQNLGIPIIKSWTKFDDDIYCFDLRSATSRWPLSFQTHLLNFLTLSPTFAEAWGALMAHRSFHYRGRTYRWQVGQPLGALSSWGMFALSHHLVVLTAYQRAVLIDPTVKLTYYMLGDDIAIKGKLLAEAYKEIVQDLGVTIQEDKTITGEAAEFCKRHFIDGSEVSPVPVKLIASACREPLLINMLVNKIAERKSINSVNVSSLDTMLKTIARNKQELQHLRLIVSNPVTGSRALDAQNNWGDLDYSVLNSGHYQKLYSVVKYNALLKQYSTLMGDKEKFLKSLKEVVLPGIQPDSSREYNPFFISLIEKYTVATANAHKRLGRFWSQTVLERDTLPDLPRMSLSLLEPNIKRRVKVEAKIILQYHGVISSLLKTFEESKRTPTLIQTGDLVMERALHRNYIDSITVKLGSTLLRSNNPN